MQFLVQSQAGPNAVVNGLFIGSGSSPGGSTLTPSHLYAIPGTYVATLTATDSARNTSSSSIAVTVNNLIPTVTQEMPAPNSTSVAVFSEVTAILFGVGTQSDTISFVLKNSSGTSVPATVSYNSSTYVVTMTPSSPLAYSTTYTATLSGAQDPVGTMSPVSWSFTTSPKMSKPAVIGVSPAPGAAGIAVPNAVLLMSISATFNEPVQSSTVALMWVDSSGNPIAYTMNYSDATNTVTAWPQVFLAYSTTYKVTVSGATDAAGTVMSPFSWSFSTASASAVTIPAVTSVSPAYNGSAVDVGTPIAVSFNEAVQASSVTATNFTLVNASGVAVPATISYSDTNSLHTATLTPTSALANSTTYTGTITGVRDAAGNTTLSPYTWSFTTASGSQTYTQLPLLYQSNLQYVGAFQSSECGYISANFVPIRQRRYYFQCGE